MKHLKNYWLIVGVLFSLMVVISSCNEDDDDNNNQPDNEVRFDNIALTGEAEAPTPVTSDGSGTLNATYNMETKVISYTVSWTLGNESDQTIGMHFHGPASVTESADVIIGITLPSDNYTGNVSGETRPLTQGEEDDLLDGLWYLNIHSTTNPAGELRGQLGSTNGNSNNSGGSPTTY